MGFYVEPRNTGEQHICAAIEAKDWLTALKLLATKKKKKSDAHFDALEFYVSCHRLDVNGRAQALTRLRLIADSGDAHSISSSATLALYDEGLNAINFSGAGPEIYAICKIRADVVKANRKDQELGIDCFKACLRYKAYDFCIQIAISLSANFKQERKYQFWIIVCRWLYSLPHDVVKSFDSPSNTHQDTRKMHGQLARAMLAKLAGQTTIGMDGAATSVGIQTPQELLLYQTVNGWQSRLDMVHENLPPDCSAAKGGWVFWRNYIEVLYEKKDYGGLFTLCQKLLMDAIPRPGDTVANRPEAADWLVWKNLIRAAAETKISENDAKVEEIIHYYMSNSVLVDKTYRRNAYLAAVEYVFHGLYAVNSRSLSKNIVVKGRTTVTIPNASRRVIALITYLFRHIGAPSVFADLRTYVLQLNDSEQAQFLLACEQIPSYTTTSDLSTATIDVRGITEESITSTTAMSQSDRITASCTYQKFVYMLALISSSVSADSETKFLHLALQNVHLYNEVIVGDESSDKAIAKSLLVTDMHPADDLLLVAVACLLQVSAQRQKEMTINTITDASILVQAAAILEYGLIASKSNAQFNLVLVRIYITLGAGALAIRAFQRLNLKRIQHDTLGHILYDRIYTLHPHRVVEQLPGSSDDHTNTVPLELLQEVQRLYTDFQEQASRNVWSSIQNGSYDAAIQIALAGDKIRHSCNSVMIAIESQRIARFSNSTENLINHPHFDNMCEVSYEDNSDYKTFPNFNDSGSGFPSLEELTRNGPAISNARIQSFWVLERIWKTVLDLKDTTAAGVKAMIESLHLLRIPSLEDEHHKTITDEEYLLLSIAREVVALLRASFCDPQSTDPASSFDACVEMIDLSLKELQSKVEDENYIPAFKQTLHSLYTFHEASHLIVLVAKSLISSPFPLNTSTKELTDKLSKKAQTLNELILTISSRVKDSVNRSGSIDRILDVIRNENARSAESQDDGETKAEGASDFGRCIEEMCDRKEPFLENFAGELTIAWRDSVQGFNLFSANML